MSNTIAILLLTVGMAFNLLGCVGLIRFPDIYNRLQAATKCVTLGTCMVLAGTMVLAGLGEHPLTTLKCFLALVFVLITSPTAAHALARGAHMSGVKLWEKSIMDKYADDKEPQE